MPAGLICWPIWKSGRLDLPAAQEWLELLWLKFNEIVLLRSSASARYFAGFPIGFNVMAGGQLPGGGDATNLLSYMCLRAQADLGLTQPNLSIRIHRDSPQDFLAAASFVIGRGSGMPQVFNDEVIVPGQVRRGITTEDALNYAVVGCVELSVPGKALGWSDAAMLNMARILELTLFGGCDPATGEQVGLVDSGARSHGFVRRAGSHLRCSTGPLRGADGGRRGCDRPRPRRDAAVSVSFAGGGRLHRARPDVTEGGAHYNFAGPQGVQVANVADSLAAVRQAVFEERWLTGDELLAALRRNFAGDESLRRRLIERVPKYGNDDERVDGYAARWAGRYCRLVEAYPTVRGGTYQPGFYTVSAHVPMGADVGATPDGRHAAGAAGRWRSLSFGRT